MTPGGASVDSVGIFYLNVFCWVQRHSSHTNATDVPPYGMPRNCKKHVRTILLSEFGLNLVHTFCCFFIFFYEALYFVNEWCPGDEREGIDDLLLFGIPSFLLFVCLCRVVFLFCFVLLKKKRKSSFWDVVTYFFARRMLIFFFLSIFFLPLLFK